MQGTKSNRSGIVNEGTISTLTNSGTIKGTGGTLSYGLYNTGTINSLYNDSAGTISSKQSKGLYNAGTITTLTNSGTIQGTGVTNSEGLYNSGTITSIDSMIWVLLLPLTKTHGLYNTATINRLYNEGTVSSTSELWPLQHLKQHHRRFRKYRYHFVKLFSMRLSIRAVSLI